MYLVLKVRYNLDKSEIKELKDRGLSEEREIIDFIESNMDFRELDTAFSHGECIDVVFEPEDKNVEQST